MMTRRCVQFALLATMTLLTAGAVMAARPSSPTTASRQADTPQQTIVNASPKTAREALIIPDDLQSHRLKIRLDRDLGARVLPNGQLFSMHGRDLSSLDALFDRLNVTLSPALTISETDLARARRRAQFGAGGTFADLGATFWADTNTNDVADIDRVARRLERVNEIEFIRFSRNTQLGRPVNKKRPSRNSQGNDDVWIAGVIDDQRDDAPDIFTVGRDAEENERVMEQASAMLYDRQVESVARANADNRRREAERRNARGGQGPRVGICCFYVYVNDVTGRGPAWIAGFNPDRADEEDCGAYVNGQGYPGVYTDLAIAPFDPPQPGDLQFLEPVWEYFDTGSATQCRPFGSCCTIAGTRGGSDTYPDDCDDDDSRFEARDWAGTDPTISSGFEDNNWYFAYKSYNNCSSCVLQYGICCFGQDALSPDGLAFTAGDKFPRCNSMSADVADAPGVPDPVINWPGAMTPNNTSWGQPAIYPGPLAAYTGIAESATMNLMPQWQGFGLPIGAEPWEGSNPYWKGSSSPGGAIVIGNSRLVTNTEDATVCENCVSLGGAYMGGPPPNPGNPSTYPNLFFDGSFSCGEPNGYIINCDPIEFDPEPSNYELGTCVSEGEALVVSRALCDDIAEGSGLAGGQGNPLWLANMINPNLMSPDPATGALVHRIHQNQYRPTWALWFTPPTNSLPDGNDASLGYSSWCPPVNPGRPDAVDPLCTGDQPNFIVPPWEYIGTYVEWTGWDPNRWWNELTAFNRGITGDPNWEFLNLTEPEFLEWYPPLDGSTGLFPGPTTADFPGIRDPAHYGHVVSFAIPPTCLEFSGSLGLATQRGVALPWDDPNTGESLWPTYPGWDRWVHHWQMQNSDPLNGDPISFNEIYPWNDGWNRWQSTIYLFDIGDPTPYPVFHGRGRYLNRVQTGTTEWLYQGDQLPPPENVGDSYVWPYTITTSEDRTGNAVMGSCFFAHSATFPTLLGTEDNQVFPGEQECYIGNYCDEASCCTAVAALIPRCCPESGEYSVWDAECVQVAVDLYLADRGNPGLDYADYTCHGITPFLAPQYPDWETFQPDYVWPVGSPTPKLLYAQGQYNPDPRNIAINPYLDATLPSWINPAATGLPPCEVADQTFGGPNNNSLNPGLPVPPTDPAFDGYATVRQTAGRLYQFMPRCQGIFSSAGQCNVPGSLSGRSAWSEVAADETLLIGCQDYDCCMRVMATLLEEKDVASDGDLYSDAEWIDFGHMGVPVGADPPALSGQWTTYMAATARELCYPSVISSDVTPDFFPLQLHAGVQAYRQSYGDLSSNRTEWIQGADGSRISDGLTSSGLPNPLSQLIWAPFSWSDPKTDPNAICVSPHQNIYEMCPGPYYRGNGLGVWPEANPTTPQGLNIDTYSTWTQAMNDLEQASGVTLNAYGEGVNIAVLGESAWLQAGTVFNPGAVHEDLENVILEGAAIGLPDITLDFTDPVATASGTAVLGIIAATANDFGVTGIAHDATTMFFPTRTLPSGSMAPAERLEDAFFNAISVLNVGDVMVLAFKGSTADGFLLNDPEVLPLIELAAAGGVHVIVPAGDSAQLLPVGTEFPGSGNVTVVGAAAPASEGNYIRWWSSNYSEVNTVTAQTALAPNLCAWGGSVTTTGGNANLTLLTIDDAAIVDSNGTYALTQEGRARSYTNDFGSQLNGSLAAAAQIAASSAAAQSFVRTWYGDTIIPAVLQDRMYTTATYGNGFGTPAGMAVTPGGGNQYTWDQNQVDPEDRYVGRVPQLGKLLANLVDVIPEDDDFAEEIPFRIIRMDVITGELLEGTRFSVALEADGEWAEFRSRETGPGFASVPATTPTPGSIYYPYRRDIVDVMFTCEVSPEAIAGVDFGVQTLRAGPSVAGSYGTWMFDFGINRWRQLLPDDMPDADPPTDYTATLFPGAPLGVNRYLEPVTNRMYIRILTVALEPVPYQWFLDYLNLADLLSPRPPG